MGLELDGLAAKGPNRIHAVAPHVHERSAVELQIEACVVRTVHGPELEAERGAENSQPPDDAARDEVRGARVCG